MSDDLMEPIENPPVVTEPLAEKNYGDKVSFNESMGRNLREIRALCLWLKDIFVPRLNVMLEPILSAFDNAQTASAGAASAAESERAAAQSRDEAAQSAENAEASATAAQAAQTACEDAQEIVTGGATVEAVPGTIPLRDEHGRFQVEAPAADKDAATKGYVDGAMPVKTTQAQVNDGTSVDAYIPPDQLNAWWGSAYAKATLSQVYSGSNIARYVAPDTLASWFTTMYAKATQAQVNAGTAVSRYVSPDALAAWNNSGVTGFGKLRAWVNASTGTTNLIKASRNVVSVTRPNGTATVVLTSGVFSNVNTMLAVVQSAQANLISTIIVNSTSNITVNIKDVNNGSYNDAFLLLVFEGV